MSKRRKKNYEKNNSDDNTSLTKEYDNALRSYLETINLSEQLSPFIEKKKRKIISKLENHFLNNKLYLSFYKKKQELNEENYDDYIYRIIEDYDNCIIVDEVKRYCSLSDFLNEAYLYLERNDAALRDILPYADKNILIKEISSQPFYGIFCNDIRKQFTLDKIDELINKNEHFNVYKERGISLRKAILKYIPENFIDLYPEARKMHRHFKIHIGPTNSGKTYESIQKLMHAKSGMYLAPLRLLAYEQFDYINKNGVPCCLLTGEEQVDVWGANITSSTIEMADLDNHYDVAVIDEAQMISDPSRGGAWSSAILGIQADEIEICCAKQAEPIIIKMIELCGDSYEIVRHERMVPLTIEKEKFVFPDDVQDGDALIVFSKKSVYSVAAELQDKGILCSVIYGALPYEVRHEEARRFAEGETKVVVSTDAIGMGMNLPIRRIVFLEISKFDGFEKRLLEPEEVKQIGGRAGRLGKFDEGFVTSCNDRKYIRKCIINPSSEIEYAVIDFPESIIYIEEPLSSIIKQWYNMMIENGFKRKDVTDLLSLCRYAETYIEDRKALYDIITLPFDMKNDRVYGLWKKLVEKTSKNEVMNFYEVDIRIPEETNTKALELLETYHKECDLFYAYSEKFNQGNYDDEGIYETKRLISGRIIEILKKNKLDGRKCRYCSRILPWNYSYGICEKCYQKMIKIRRT